MSDRPDLDKAIEIAQAGGIKITGGKYAPDGAKLGATPLTTNEELRVAIRKAFKKDPNYADFIDLTGDMGIYDIESRIIASVQALLDQQTKEAGHEVDHNIDVRYESDPIEAFNKFIKKWCPDYSHLIDSDENDGEFMREKIAQALSQNKTGGAS